MTRAVDSPNKTSSKKPYQEPQLVAYGGVREITQAINNPGGNFDGVTVGRPPGSPRQTGGDV